MDSSKDFSTTPLITAVDFIVPIFIILFLTKIAICPFILLHCFILAGVVIGTVWDYCNFNKDKRLKD